MPDPNVSVTGGYPDNAGQGGYVEAPNYLAPSTNNGPAGVISTGENTIVDGIRVTGRMAVSHANIALSGNGSIARNCVADEINATTETNNQTKAEWGVEHP